MYLKKNRRKFIFKVEKICVLEFSGQKFTWTPEPLLGRDHAIFSRFFTYGRAYLWVARPTDRAFVTTIAKIGKPRAKIGNSGCVLVTYCSVWMTFQYIKLWQVCLLWSKKEIINKDWDVTMCFKSVIQDNLLRLLKRFNLVYLIEKPSREINLFHE